MRRGAVAEIDLAALKHNLSVVRGLAGTRTLISVVKADAYGHGAVQISKGLASAGVGWFAVAYSSEAGVLRESGISGRIIVLFDRSGFDDFFAYDLVPVIHDRKTAEALSGEALRRHARIAVHVKIDTGMGRMGLPYETAAEDLGSIARMPGLSIEGLMSHFSEADLDDRSFCSEQLALFNRVRDDFVARTGIRPVCHVANSAALLSLNDAYLDAVRPGLALYGISPCDGNYDLRSVMRVKTRILTIRDVPAGRPVSYGRTFVTQRPSRIAVLPIGYADGYSRLFSNNASVLVRGQYAPVVGRVCMDLTMVDVTDIRDACEDDEVVLLGRQGNNAITAPDLAARSSTISYEILTGFGGKSRREFIRDDAQ